MLGRLKCWRRISNRCNRCAHTFFSAICIAAALIFYLNAYSSGEKGSGAMRGPLPSSILSLTICLLSPAEGEVTVRFEDI